MAKHNHGRRSDADAGAAQSGVRKAHAVAPDDVMQKANEHLVLEVLRSNAAEEQLREVAEFRERLIGVIGHDLRNPLGAVLMAAGLLASGGHLSETEAKLAARILTSGQRIKRILAALVDFTRARLGGGFDLHMVKTDAGYLCEQIAAELRLAASANIDVQVRGDVVGMWDEAHLGEALSNVAGNAVEYAARQTAVVIDAYDAGGDVVAVAITNRGPTIPKDSLEHIFEPFKRPSTSVESRPGGHLGLGLFIAHQVIVAHGGTLDATSVGGETTFTARLPRWPS